MICKMVFGNSFKGCLDYITGKYNEDKHTRILVHSNGIPDMDNKAIAQVFEAYARKGGHDIEKPVGHFAYSFHKDDSDLMNDSFMARIVMEHMQMLGIRNTEFIIGRHYDTDHDHCHLMFSMVDNDGNVIDDSMIFARNLRICKYLTKKYGLTMSSEKDKVNRDKLRGKEKLKYEFYDRVMRCKEQSSNWKEFDKALKADGLKLHFHYNNVSGNLMGVVFSDGKHSFGGKQLDEKLKLDSLIKDFGDLKHITHDSVREWYEDYHDRLREINSWSKFRNLMKIYPEFDSVFPDGEYPDFNYKSVPGLLYDYSSEAKDYFMKDYVPSDDGRKGYIGLQLLCEILLNPYEPQMSIGGGGGSTDNRGWRDLDDEEKEKYRFRFNFSAGKSRPSIRKNKTHSLKR